MSLMQNVLGVNKLGEEGDRVLGIKKVTSEGTGGFGLAASALLANFVCFLSY